MTNNKTFCILPWVQAVIRTDGSINPCCAMHSGIANINNNTIEDYYNSAAMNNMRKNMLDGNTIGQCNDCTQAENKVGTSVRTEANTDYKFISINHYQKLLTHFKFDKLTSPNRIELHVGNLCNLKCLTCHPSDSSSFLTEDKIIGISNFDQAEFTLNDKNLSIISTQILHTGLEILDFRGGESLIIPSIKQLCKNIDNTIASNITLRVQTNGTIFNEEWKEIFNKFKSVEVMVSIDAYGDDNRYIRFPADWDSIINTLAEFKKISTVHQLYVNTMVSNLNWPVLPKFFDWLIDNDISCKLQPLVYPDYYQITNLPINVFNKHLQEIKQYQNKFRYTTTNQNLAGLISYAEKNANQEMDQVKWNKFCEIITKRDTYRKNSIFTISPELREYWNA